MAVGARGLLVAGAAGALAGCYAPQPPTGAPCPNGVCPTPLVCSPLTSTCERGDVDAGGSGHGYRVAITFNASEAASDVPVLVVLDATFGYAHAAADGSDVRLAGDTAATEMPHWTETWTFGGVSRIWGRVPSVAAGGNTIYAYYGTPALMASDFATVFPNTYRTTGDAMLGGAVAYDAVLIEAGHTVTAAAGMPLAITASYVRITGTLSATAAGYAGATGPGAGGMSANGGAGGGGHGGDGGLGGKDAADTPGPGGAANGAAMTEDIDMGSGGGVTDVVTTGAHGGGAVRIDARRIIVDGSIDAHGEAGTGAARSGGGGAGGGVLLRASSLAFAGTISVAGGAGGPMMVTGNDGGGGGGGGRIKMFDHGEVTNTGMTDVDGGIGGPGGDTAPGQPGLAGTMYAGTSMTIDALPVVGGEQSL